MTPPTPGIIVFGFSTACPPARRFDAVPGVGHVHDGFAARAAIVAERTWPDAGVATIIVTTFIVNLRHTLSGPRSAPIWPGRLAAGRSRWPSG